MLTRETFKEEAAIKFKIKINKSEHKLWQVQTEN